MNKISILIAALSAAWLVSGDAAAQQSNSGGGLQFGPDEKLMFEAATKVMKRDFKGAEAIYDEAIADNDSNTEAYLQRGIVRRQLGDAQGTAADGQKAVLLADAAIKNNPRNPNLYYQRGMGFRLLKNYARAKEDITIGMNLGGPQSWQTDLQAIEFEKKEANSN